MIELAHLPLRAVLPADVPVLLQWYAVWSGPCREMLRRVEALEAHFSPRVAFARGNVDDCSTLAIDHDVTTIPTLFIYRPGLVLATRLIGLRPAEEIALHLHRLLE